ncbi:hypothetical protein SAMN02745115_01520 [[Eubacterium] yurii]|jgi:hypothetical protein|nr:hypothetical protein SAMN02745115_01520 [[Eubacterium] yurii]
MKKYVSIIIMMSLSLFLCSNIEASTKSKTNSYNKSYDYVINDYYDFVANFSGKSDSTQQKYYPFADVASLAKNDSLEAIGYTIKDVTGDKVPELIFGFIIMSDGKKSLGKEVLALYTIEKGKAKLVFQGGNGYKYYNLGGGKFVFSSHTQYYEVFGSFALSKNGDKLVYDDFNFIDFTDIDNIVHYSNKTGALDKKSSKKQSIVNDKYQEMIDETILKSKEMEFTPLKKFKKADNKAQKISVYEEEQVKAKYKNYLKYSMKSNTFKTKLFFVPSNSVKDFKLYGLTYKSMDDKGKVKYDKKVLFSVNTLTAQKPLLADVEPSETVPTTGISFVDNKGKTQKYVVLESGEDGSLLLSESDF